MLDAGYYLCEIEGRAKVSLLVFYTIGKSHFMCPARSCLLTELTFYSQDINDTSQRRLIQELITLRQQAATTYERNKTEAGVVDVEEDGMYA